MSDEEDLPEGRRKDGRPYRPGNTRKDGSYKVGKNRPSPDTQFRKGDGRKRGRRPKGGKNLATDWREELSEKITVVENGVRKRLTKQRGIVKKTTARALKDSDRATEIVFRHAGEIEQAGSELRLADQEIIELWLAQRQAASASNGAVTDDLDEGHRGPEAGDADQ